MSGSGVGTVTSTGYANKPRLTGTLTLQSDGGQQVISGDPRNTIFTFSHDALFRGFGSIQDIHKYIGFRIAVNNMMIKNTASAPSATGNALVNVLFITNNPPLVSGNSSGIARNVMVMARYQISTSANGWGGYYNTSASEYIVPFSSDGQYVFQVILTTGVISTDVMNFTGGYQPTSWAAAVAIELIPRE